MATAFKKYPRSYWSYGIERDMGMVPYFLPDITTALTTATITLQAQAFGIPSLGVALSTAVVQLAVADTGTLTLIRDAATWVGHLDDSTSHNSELADTAYEGSLAVASYKGKLDDDV